MKRRNYMIGGAGTAALEISGCSMLRYIINADLNPDIILGGMFSLDHVYENIPAFYNPGISDEEKRLLRKLRKVTEIASANWLPDYYRFLDTWVPDSLHTEHV